MMHDLSVIDVKGNTGSECFLVLSDKSAVMVDSGQDYCSEAMAANVRAALNGRPLDLILLTHSHYDHASGSAYLKLAFPAAQVVASCGTSDTFKKEKAIAVMRELNKASATRAGMKYNDHLDGLAVDKTVQDGDVIATADMTIRVIESAGHTKCSLCYYFEEYGLLAASETLGLAFELPQRMLPCNVIGHKSSLASVDRAAACRPRQVLAPHVGLVGPDVPPPEYFSKARDALIESKDLILEGYREGKTLDLVLQEYTGRYYTATYAEIVPENAFLLNTKFLIPKVLAEYGHAFT